MIDWSRQMSQDFEYWVVNPNTWTDSRKLDYVNSCSIKYDASAETIGTANFTSYERLPECYVRAYLIAKQNGIEYKIPLGTNLVQTPSVKYDGFVKSMSINAYSPLVELRSNSPSIGYSILKNTNVSSVFNSIYSSNCRAPLIGLYNTDKKVFSDFVAEDSDSWLSFLNSLLAMDDRYITINANGEVGVAKNERMKAIEPSYIFTDNNSSILYPDTTDAYDYFDIPNRVEVSYSGDTASYFSRVENTDQNSELSIPNRGRVVLYRETSPEFTGIPNQTLVDQYARNLMKTKCTITHEITIKHAYCGVGINETVILDMKGAGYNMIKGLITSQSIDCSPGIPTTSTIKYSEELWTDE